MELHFCKNPVDNRTYVEGQTTYDSFENELSYIDENGLTPKTSYVLETGEEIETINGGSVIYIQLRTESHEHNNIGA